MNVSIEDLNKIKLSPSLIVFLRAIHEKNEEYIVELNKVANVFSLANFLQDRMIIKITGKELSCNSFEIRDLKVINYFNNINNKSIDKDIDQVINYFIEITGKTRTSLKSSSNRKFIKARLQEYNVQDLKDVILLKYKEWKNDPMMKNYIRIETLFNSVKFQSYIGQLDLNIIKDFKDDI